MLGAQALDSRIRAPPQDFLRLRFKSSLRKPNSSSCSFLYKEPKDHVNIRILIWYLVSGKEYMVRCI